MNEIRYGKLVVHLDPEENYLLIGIARKDENEEIMLSDVFNLNDPDHLDELVEFAKSLSAAITIGSLLQGFDEYAKRFNKGIEVHKENETKETGELDFGAFASFIDDLLKDDDEE